MSEHVTKAKERMSFAHSMKEAVTNKFARSGALIAVAGTSLVGYASAAIDFSNISELLQAVIQLIPDFLALVVAIAPLLVTVAIVAFVLGFLKAILGWISSAW
jgi:uncharacterized membrane protein